MSSQVEGAHGPEREVALDMARLGLIVGPVLMAFSAVFWQLGGLASSLLAIVLVVANLVGGAWIIGRAAAVSPNLLTGAVLGGFVLRLAALTAIVLPLRGLGWFEVVPFSFTLLGGHLGLLTWESQRVSAILSRPAAATSSETTTSDPATDSARARSESK